MRRNSTSEWSSETLFIIGVPVRHSRYLAVSILAPLAPMVARFLMHWASSSITLKERVVATVRTMLSSKILGGQEEQGKGKKKEGGRGGKGEHAQRTQQSQQEQLTDTMSN
jgi:hypothetical protein